MKILEKIPFTEIESIPLLIKDFLNQKIDGFEDNLFSIENFEKKIDEKKWVFSSEQRDILHQSLEKQLSGLNLSEIQHKNLHKLKKSNTFTITTGHQLNFFTGPVFFVYKILQTVKTAIFLKEKFPNQEFVPVFWMATEDHDFAEINHFKTEENFYELKGKSGGAVGRIAVEDCFFISEFEKELKDSVFGIELILMMKEAYKNGKTLAEATKILVNRLFSEFGLLIIDGDDKALKAQMKSIFKDEVCDFSLFKNSEKEVGFLRNNYGKVQVNPREINLFYLTETRNRIDVKVESFHIDGTEIYFSKNEILEEIENHPEKFSPNALLRPVYQEKILPNLAYIGGNAEIMYWLELKNHFEKLNIPFPVLIPRNSMLFLKEKTVQKIEKNGLKVNDFFKNFADLVKHQLLDSHEITILLKEKETLLQNSFHELKIAASQTDVTFGNLVNAEEKRQLKSFERMKKRLLRAEKIKQKEKLQRLENLFLEVHPSKNWQERVFNFSVFYADNGKNWLETCLKEMDVQKSELIIMEI